MKFYLLNAAATAFLTLGLSTVLFSQENNPPPPPPPPIAGVPEIPSGQDQIIIKNDGKDMKITVEIKDGKVLINGRPAEEYKGDDVILRKGDQEGKNYFYFNGPDQDFTRVSPFTLGGSNDRRSYSMSILQAFLGVASTRNVGGGARITNVSPGSGAEKAGLKKDDIIKKINDIDINEPSDLTDAVHQSKPNDKITVTFIRDGKEQKTEATLGKHKMAQSFSYAMPNMDIQPGFKNFNFDFPNYMFKREHHHLGIKAQDTEDDKGAKVLDVDEDSPAGKAGIKEGDIITQFDGKPVINASSLAELARSDKDKSTYRIRLTRNGNSMELEVKIPKDLKTADL